MCAYHRQAPQSLVLSLLRHMLLLTQLTSTDCSHSSQEAGSVKKKQKKRRCRSGLPGGRFLFYPFICFLSSIDRDSFSSSHNIVSSYCSVCAGDCPKGFLFSKVKKVSKPACVRVLSLLIHMSSCCGQISNSQSTHGPILNPHPALQYHHVLKAVKGS